MYRKSHVVRGFVTIGGALFMGMLLVGAFFLWAKPVGAEEFFPSPKPAINLIPGWSASDVDDYLDGAWGDIDGDGDLDWATAVNGNNKIYLNEGEGLALLPYWLSDEADISYGIAWGDVDGDGDLDLAVANDGANKIYLNQDGVMQTTAVWSSADSRESRDLVWGDIDGDGDLDLAVANADYNDHIYENDNGMLLPTPIWTSTNYFVSFSIAWGDVDNDGDLDLTTGHSSTPPKLYLNSAGVMNSFASWTGAGFGLDYGLDWGDMNGDGFLDLAVSRSTFGTPHVYLNMGGMLTNTISWFVPTSMLANDVAWGDADGDGDLDLAIADQQWNRIYFNTGTMLTSTNYWSSADLAQSQSVDWADVTGDGRLDLTFSNNDGQPSRIYFNQASNFNPLLLGESLDQDSSSDIAWGDFDGDGDLDLAVANNAQNRLYTNLGTVIWPIATWSSTDTDYSRALAWGDYDGDGDLDLAVANQDAADVIYEAVGGTLSATPVWSSTDSFGSFDLAWGDVDNDGDLDLAVAVYGIFNGGCQCYENNSNHLYLNNNGVISTSPDWSSTEADISTGLAWGDIDNDGDLDLAVSNYGDWLPGCPCFSLGKDKIYLNEGGMLLPTAVWESEDSDLTRKIQLGDINGDGFLDLVAGNSGTTQNKLYLNNQGMMNRLPDWASDSFNNSQDIALADVDNDGDLDLGVNNFGNSIQIYNNVGGIFEAVPSWESGITSNRGLAISFGDMDRDGDLELAAASFPIWNAGCGCLEYGENQVFYNQLNGANHLPDGLGFLRLEPIGGLAQANDFAVQQLITETVIPINYTIMGNDQIGSVRGYYSVNGGDSWRVAVPTTDTNRVHLSPGMHQFKWDSFASGFFGKSDQVVFRLVGLPQPETADFAGSYQYTRTQPIIQKGYMAVESLPFRLQGTQIQVFSGSNPIAGATVYQISEGASVGSTINDGTGTPFVTDQAGYLQGFGILNQGDGLVATSLISYTEQYSLYYTSAAPTINGLATYTMSQPGVQQLIVSDANPLTLFHLSVSLEWDARKDSAFLEQLETDINRASEIFYDVTNGQAALGEVTVYQNRENWLDANLIIPAANTIRPSASLGGSVLTFTHDLITGTSVITDAYMPGQIRMGPSWNRFGDSAANQGEDWARALAHEMGHYYLFLPDNYLGMENGRLVTTDCYGSLMSNAYLEEYSEFLDQLEWLGDCLKTVAELTTGRTDWETIRQFYPWFHYSSPFVGPNQLPLVVSKIHFITPATPDNSLASPYFSLRDNVNAPIQIDHGKGAGYLFKNWATPSLGDDYLISLGSPKGDQMVARGAAPGDRLCVYDYSQLPNRLGCQTVAPLAGILQLEEMVDWVPLIQTKIVTTSITGHPILSQTMKLIITLTQPISVNQDIYVQIIPNAGITEAMPISSTIGQLMATNGENLTFTQEITLPYPAINGVIRVWVDGVTPIQEAVLPFYMGDGWGANRMAWGANRMAWGANRMAWGANRMAWGAPVSSGDGQVTIFNFSDIFADTGTNSLQALMNTPPIPSWLEPVGQLYRFEASSLISRTIAFHYLQSDVPGGTTYENLLTIYYSADEGKSWQRLDTMLDVEDNLATATMPEAKNGNGLYGLVSTVPIGPFATGWNNFGYPIPESRIVTDTVASIAGKYSSIYQYDAFASLWQIYDGTIVAEQPAFAGYVNDLTQFEFAKAYWIYATEPITLYVKPPVGSGNLVGSLGLQLPPTTYYGWVTPTAVFTPTVGMSVGVWVDGNSCGTGTIVSLNGKLAYKVQLMSENFFPPYNGCGSSGRTAVFVVDGQTMDHDRSWDNSQAWYHPLSCLVPQVSLLGGGVSGTDLLLSWTESFGEQYEVWYGDNLPYFVAGADCGGAGNCSFETALSHVDSGIVGNVGVNRYYQLVSGNSCGGRSGASNTFGEFDFAIVPGS